MTRLTLFSTAGCHLCEEAERLVSQCLATASGVLEIRDIADDPALTDRYGVSIPVLRNEATGMELNWPFEMDDIHMLLMHTSLGSPA